MPTTTVTGGCHCGDVRFEADVDLAKPTGKCNCSFCAKTRNWSLSVDPKDFRLTKGEDASTDYQWNTKSIHWYFCKRCGVRSYAPGHIEAIGPPFVSIAVMSLDLTPDQLAALAVHTSDGKHDNWQHEASRTEQRYL
jgi:hypothetical protein